MDRRHALCGVHAWKVTLFFSSRRAASVYALACAILKYFGNLLVLETAV
jgi:hypothetical protein